jgi:hypothetical protein
MGRVHRAWLPFDLRDWAAERTNFPNLAVGGFNFCVQGTYSASIRCDDVIDPGREDRQMLLYVQTWLPLLTITLTAAIFFSVASFIMGHAKA